MSTACEQRDARIWLKLAVISFLAVAASVALGVAALAHVTAGSRMSLLICLLAGSVPVVVVLLARSIACTLRELTGEARNVFPAELADALEMVDAEQDVHAVVARAMESIATDLPMEMLVADSSHAHLERACVHPLAGSPQCAVESPYGCAAVRRGAPVTFADSEALNACPRLRGRPEGPVCAVCVPVSFMGRALGVVHAARPVAQQIAPQEATRLVTLGMQSGSRIGIVRAFRRTQTEASTDALTGLANRRMLDSRLHELARSPDRYAFVLADLDHFKSLNDNHGHEAGDRALRVFGEVLQRCLRDTDLAARCGGEEFAFVIPEADAARAGEVVERVRTELAQALMRADVPHYTASFGIADTDMTRDPEHLQRVADDALYRAKEQGRDRACLGDPRRLAPTVPRRQTEHNATIDLRMLAA
jgi:diguanylate cyclase (GGDEF)-like protein